MTTTANKRQNETKEPSWVEWTTGIVSALVVILMIGWVGWEAVTEDIQEPSFTIAVKTKAEVDGGYRVTFEIANAASRTASAVVVRGEILDGAQVVEDADVTFDYVPARSKSSGAILFSQDPGNRPVRLRAIGYTDP